MVFPFELNLFEAKIFSNRTFMRAFAKKLCMICFASLGFAALGGAISGAATAGVLEETPAVPSGNEIALQEILFEVRQDDSRVARFRYVMPLMRQGLSFAEIEEDFFHLCIGVAVPYLAVQNETVDQVIISMADRETDFGVTTSLATQYFEAFRVENGTCIWEGF